jgi:tRNA A-37 threonylcarbamoyl transferase component Bud32
VTPEFYRLTGKLRAVANLLFLIANFALAPRTEALGFDVRVLWNTLIAFTAVHLTDGLIGVWVWRGHLSARRMRQLTYASAVLESVAAVVASWIYGSVSSQFFGIELMFILIYRLAFDFRIGAVTFVLIFCGQWLIVALELAHVIPPQPIAIGAIDGVYALPAREIGAQLNLSFVMLLTFAVASWAVGRIRHKEQAIRLLRESLSAAERARVGHHTGRTLRDTYAVGPLLGVGGMGEVYEAIHLRTQRRLAVKMLRAHLVADATVMARFRREAEVTGKLGSEHIVGVIDIDEDDGQPFLVLELVEGESLAARLASREPIAPAELANMVEQLARGLDIAHGAGIVHRDLKPENVFLCPRKDGLLVKILDFGVSKILRGASAITHEVAMLGTPDFMSPEQAQGRADEVEATSDIFALGGIIYTCIAGRRPFIADSVPAVLRKICDDEPPPLADAAVQAVIARAMAKDPRKRYATASELAAELSAALRTA